MRKRIFAFLLTLCLLGSLLPQTISPARAYSDTDIPYAVEGGNIYFNKETGTITDCDETVTKADIPAEIDGVAVTTIGDRAFHWCDSLTSVTIPDGVTSIGEQAFERCGSLTSVTIPDSVTSIGDEAFYVCSKLTNVTIPDSVTSIGKYAFRACHCLTIMKIPASVTSIGEGPFTYCSGLKRIWVNGNNLYYNSDDSGVLFNKDRTELIQAPGAISNYTIPNSVTSINNYALYGCGSLTSITIPNSVTSIGNSAFSKCSSLTSVTIPVGVTSIGNDAFFECSSLTSVTIPDGVTSIGDGTFEGCSSLTSITIPNSVTSIGVWAFNGCSSLTSVTIPDSVTSIGDRAFFICSRLASVYFQGNAPELGSQAFQMWDTEIEEYVSIPGLTLYFIEGKAGWTTPTWNGYTTLPGHIHQYNGTVTPPTCTEQGYTTHICSVCGDSYVDTYVDALGHTEAIDPTMAPTCTETGLTEGKHCSVCNTVLVKQETAAALGHDYGEWTQTVAPTCTEKGEEKRTCSRCDAFELRGLAALGHTEAIDPAVAPTCTEAGLSEGKHCSACNAVLVKQEPAAALGHDFKDGVCTRCGEKAPAQTFPDVKESAWYYDAVMYATSHGIFKGNTDGTFGPGNPMNRAMLVTTLHRLAGEPAPKAAAAFSDVDAARYYAKPVAWAAENGIVNGMGDNKFQPNANVTREQAATFLYRYAAYAKLDTTARADLSKFPDANKVSNFAKDSLSWASAEGLINGKKNTQTGVVSLSPKGSATRAELAKILMNFMENVAK